MSSGLGANLGKISPSLYLGSGRLKFFQSLPDDVLYSLVDSSGLIFNYSIFFTGIPKWIIGVEFLIFFDVNFNKFSYFAVFPQVQAQITEELRFDVGPGLAFTALRTIPFFGSRILIETEPKESESETESETESEAETETDSVTTESEFVFDR